MYQADKGNVSEGIMSIIMKVKNMSAHKPNERVIEGTARDRGYDIYKILNSLLLGLGVSFLAAITVITTNMSEVLTTERILVGKHEIRLDNHDGEFNRYDGRLVRVEDKITEFDVRLGEHAVKDALYQNPFKRDE